MEELFKKKQLKITNQRKMVFTTINELGSEATLKNITKKCEIKMDQSTIYRIIDLLVLKEIFEKRINYNEEIYYAVKEEHGHYFTCVKCHKREKIENCPIEELEYIFETEKGYEILDHTVQINGICNKCKNI